MRVVLVDVLSALRVKAQRIMKGKCHETWYETQKTKYDN